MGQATVDLPDPLQTPPVSAANTDDLLAQLAGEEIDRLLAEADTGAPPATPPSAAPGDVPTNAASNSTTSVPSPAPETPASANGSTTSAELDDLLGQLDVAAPSPAEKGPPPTSAVQAAVAHTRPAPATPEEHPVAAELDEDARMAAGGGAFNTSVIAEAKADVASIAPKAVIATSSGLPVYLRPLEWLNAPLALCPDQVRDTIGKIAILTTVNALSVLAYVLLFRSH